MLELVVMSALAGYFLPYITFPAICVLLFFKYKSSSPQIREIQNSMWKKVTSIQLVSLLVNYAGTFAKVKQEDIGQPENFFNQESVFIPMTNVIKDDDKVS